MLLKLGLSFYFHLFFFIINNIYLFVVLVILLKSMLDCFPTWQCHMILRIACFTRPKELKQHNAPMAISLFQLLVLILLLFSFSSSLFLDLNHSKLLALILHLHVLPFFGSIWIVIWEVSIYPRVLILFFCLKICFFSYFDFLKISKSKSHLFFISVMWNLRKPKTWSPFDYLSCQFFEKKFFEVLSTHFLNYLVTLHISYCYRFFFKLKRTFKYSHPNGLYAVEHE